MKTGISPIMQVIAMTAYIALCAGLIVALHSLGLSEETIATAAVAAVGAGLFVSVWLVGFYSWAIATALAWLGMALAVIATYG